MKRKLALIPGKIHQRIGLKPTLILFVWMIGYFISNATGPVLPNPLSVVAPSNDDLCNAIPLSLGATCNGFAYTTFEATLEANEPIPCFTPVRTVWFSFSAPPSGIVEITTSNSNGALYIGKAVYSLAGGPCSDLLNLIQLDCGIDTLIVCGLTNGQTYYVQVVSDPAPNEDNFCIEITGEAVANAGFNQLSCDSFTTVIAVAPVIGTGMWSVVSGTATLATPTSPTTLVTGMEYGTVTTLQWTITNGICPPAADQMTISVLTDPDAGPDQQLCTNVNSTTLAANTPIMGDGLWGVVSGMATFADFSSPTTSVMLTPGMPTTLVWFTFFGIEACNIMDTMVITWSAEPSLADAGPDQILCAQTSTTLAANTPIIGMGSWNVVSGTANITDPSSPTSEITGLLPGTSVILEWTIASGGCTPSTDEVMISVDELPMAEAGPYQQTLCGEFTTTLTGNMPMIGVGTWSVASGTAVITDPSSPTSEVTGLLPAYSSALLKWTITNGSCVSVDSIYLVEREVPIANAGMDQQLCNVTSTVVSANPFICSDGMMGCETGLWTVTDACGSTFNMITITDPTSPTTNVADLEPGCSYTLQWNLYSDGGFCSASDEVIITIDALPTLAAAGPDQQLCNQTSTTLTANSPMVGVGSWTLISGTAMITDPSSPTSGVTGLLYNTPTTLQWNIANGTCPTSTDQMTITATNLPEMADAGPDQYLCEMNTTTLAGNMPSAGSGMWSVVNGMATITDPTSSTSGVTGLLPPFSAVYLKWTIANGFCFSTDYMYITVEDEPVANAGIDQQLCNVTATVLNANEPGCDSENGCETGSWNVISGSASVTNPSSATSGVTGLIPGGSVTLEWTLTTMSGSCSGSDQMTIIVDDLPTAADAGADQELCDQTSTYLTANTPLIGTGMWNVINGTGMITDPTSPTTEVTGLENGTLELEWRISNGVCTPTLDTVTITIYTNPDISLAGPDQHLCNQSNTTLAANTPVYGSGLWSLISGTANILDLSSPTSGVTGLIAGIPAVLQWTISNGTCIESIDQMTILVDELPTLSNAGPDQQFCNLTTATLAGNNPAIGSGLWSVVSGTANITNLSSPTSGVTGLVPGTTAILAWTITNGLCPPSVDQVMITSHALPTISNAGPDQQLCNQGSTTLAANTALVGNGFWSVVSGTVNITNLSSPTSGVTGLLTDASVVLRWTITNGTCPPSIDQVTITVHALPSASNAGPDQQLCNQTTTTLAANTPGIGTGQWSLISGSANITTPGSPSSGVTGLIPGTTAVLAWTITNGTCPSNVDQVSITVYAPPTTSNAGPDQQLCNQTTTTLAANTPVFGTGLWSVISGTANFTNPTSPTSGVTNLVNGSSVVLQWTITNGTCVPSIDQITITTFALPTTSNAGPDKELCNLTSTTLSGNNPPVGTGQWSVISGTANITNPASSVSSVTGLIPGTSVVLQWSITNGVCPPSTDQMTITTYELPTTANAGPDQELCNVTTTTLNANIPIDGTGFWTVITGPANITTPTSPTSGVTGLEPGTVATLQWKITNGTCPPSMDQMKIRVYELPSIADAGPDKFLCDQSATIVNAEVPIIGTGAWTVISGGTAIVIPDDQPNAAVLSLLTGTTTILQWSVTNGTCPPSIDQLNITVSDFPTQSDAGPDQVVCQSTTTYLQGNQPEVGVGYWLKISGPGEVTDPESPTSEITGLQPGIPTILQWTIWNSFCQPSSDEVTIEISEINVQEADAGPDQSICGETSVVLAGNSPMNGSGHWTIVEGIATINDSNNPNAEVTDLESGNTVILEWTITNGDCPSSSDQVSIFTDVSTGIANAGPDLSFCTDEMIVVEGNMPANGNGLWTLISGNAEITDSLSPITSLTAFQPGTSIVLQWTVTNDGCLPDSDQVVIHFDAAPTVAEAGLDFTLCETSSLQLSANTPLLGIGSWSVISGNAMIADSSSPTSVLSGLTPGTTTVLAWSIGNGSCPLSVDQLSIQVDALPTASDAGADQMLCDQTSTTLAANTPLIGQGSWTILDGSATLEDSLSPSTSINDLQPGTTVTLQWTVTNGVCQESSDLVTIQVNQETSAAVAGPDQVLCGNASTIIQANTPEYGQGQWIIVNGNAEIADSLSPITTLTDLQPGTSVTLQWTISNGICASTSDELIIQINEAPSTADAGTDQAFCDQTESILNAVAPSIGTGQWDIISGSGMLNDLAQPNTTVSGLDAASPLVLRWVTTFGNCQSQDTITLSTYESPTPANAGEDQSLCTSETILHANTPLIGQGTWSVVFGTVMLADTSSPTTSITGLIPGTVLVLQWTIANGICPESSDQVEIFPESAAPIAIAGEDQHLCDQTIAIIQALPANIGTGMWTILSGSGIIQDSSAETTAVTSLLPGVTILRWTVSGTACPPAYDDVVITIDEMPLSANAGPDETICSDDLQLSAQDPIIGTGTWTIISGLGSLQNQFDPLTFLTDLPEGTSIILEWKITNGICPSVADTITITTSLPPDIPVVSDDQILCNSNHAILSGNNPSSGGGIGIWSLLSGAGDIENVNDSITAVTGLAIGTNFFVWTISNGACAPLSDTVMIQNNDHAELNSNFLVSEFACAGDSVHMFDISGNTTLPTSFFWDFGDNTTSAERDPIHEYAAQGDYTITLTTHLEGCGSVSTSKLIRVFNCLSNNPGNGGTRKILYANVVPNPSIEDFQVNIKLREESEVNIVLYDAAGRLIQTRKIVEEKDIKEIFEVEASGLYFFQVQVGYEVLIFKVVKVNGSN